MKLALVFSGGGLFGAWQAGVWCALERKVQPDLVVGASVGALNGYAISCGADGEKLKSLWRDSGLANLGRLRQNIQTLTAQYKPRVPLSVAVTDLLRMKPVVFRDEQITWRHMAASCAIPGVFRQYWIDGILCSDGGLLNALPVWAAVEQGATHVIAVHALPVVPSVWLGPVVKGFKAVAGFNPPVPENVHVDLIVPSRQPLGTLSDAIRWKGENIERWLAEGFEDGTAQNISIPDCLER